MIKGQPQANFNPTYISFGLFSLSNKSSPSLSAPPMFRVSFLMVLFLSSPSSCVICVPLAAHQWLLNTTATPNIDVRLWKAWTLRLWSLKRRSPVWKTPGPPVPRLHCRYELGTKYGAPTSIWVKHFISIDTSGIEMTFRTTQDKYSSYLKRGENRDISRRSERTKGTGDINAPSRLSHCCLGDYGHQL